MSRLVVDQLQGRTSGSNTITIPAGHKINAVDAGGFVHPGSIVQQQVVFAKANAAGYYNGTDPTVGNHTSPTTAGAGANVDGDGYWAAHVISFTTTTPFESGWSIDITPKYANSIIRIEHNPHIYSSTANDTVSIRFVRTISGGTATVVYQPQGNTTSNYGLWYGGATYFQPTIVAYDKPATTTSTNYKVYIHTYGGGTHYYGGHVGASQWAPKIYFSVTEIAQ